jgi:hypothetical protein
MNYHRPTNTPAIQGTPPADRLQTARRLGVVAAVGLGLALAASDASAMVTTFAVFSPVGTAPDIKLTGLALTANDTVRFRFTDPGLSSLGLISAHWNFNATETSASAFGAYELATFDGSFSYSYVGPTVVTAGGHTINAGDNLLTGTFSKGIFSGSGSAASLNASSSGVGNVVLSSSLLGFNPTADEGLSLSFTSIVPPTEVVPPGKLADFTAVSSGTFAAGLSAVPEPATWALMLMGMGGLGAALRSRRTMNGRRLNAAAV